MRRKFAASLLMVVILIGVVFAVGGSPSDPLISLRYLNDTYEIQTIQTLTEQAEGATDTVYQATLARLQKLAKTYLEQAGALDLDDGMNHSTDYTITKVKRGDAMDVAPGSSVLMLAGRANIAAGTLVDMTAGVEQGPGAALVAGHRYLVVGSGMATVAAVSDIARIAPKGAFAQRVSGKVVTPFTDLAEIDWFYGAARYCYMGGLFNGTSGELFSPNGSMTRSMLATVLHRLAGAPAATGHGFTDVADNTWYSAPVAWAASAGVVQGMGEGLFVPDGLVTREQMAVMLHRFAGMHLKQDVTASASLSQFKDSAQVAPWASEAIKWAVGAGVVTGRNDGTLDPGGTASRAEVATMLQRFSILISVG